MIDTTTKARRAGRSRLRPVLRAGTVVCFFGMLSFISLHQPVFNVATHMTGDKVTDYYHFNWNYWWVRHALTNGLPLYETNYVFTPAVSNLAYHTLAPAWYPVWALVEPVGGTIAGMTAIFWLALALNGISLYVLLRSEGASSAWALVGGAWFALSPLLLNAVYWSMTSLLSWFWLPVLILLWRHVAAAVTTGQARSAAGSAALFGAAFALMILTDLQYPLFTALLLVPIGLLTLWRARRRVWRLAVYGVGTLLLAGVLLWGIGLLPALLAFDRVGLAPTPVERAVAIRFPEGYVTRLPSSEAVSFGSVALPLIGLGVVIALLKRQRSARWGWLGLMVVPLVLTAGGMVMIGGMSISLPYRWLHEAFGGMFRYPERFMMPAVIAGLCFALPVWSRIGGRWRRALPLAALALVLVDGRLFESIPIQPQPTRYEFYELMGREPIDYAVVEVPTGGSSGEGIVGRPEFSALQFYGITHGKRMINGHISRVNTYRYMQMNTDDPLWAWLGQRRYLEADGVRELLRERIFSYPIGYIVIHRDLIWRDGPTMQEIIGFLNRQDDLVCPYRVEGEAVVYRTRWHPDGCPPRTPPLSADGWYTIDVGGADDVRYLGWGWHPAETVGGLNVRWAGEYPQADVYLDLPSSAYEVSLTAQSFDSPRSLTLQVNRQTVGDAVRVPVENLQTFTFSVPQALIGDGQHITLTLVYDAAVSPRAVGQGADERRLALMVDAVRLQPR